MLFLSGKLLDFGCGRKPYKHLFSFDEYIGLDIVESGHNHEDEEIDVYYDGTKIPFERITSIEFLLVKFLNMFSI